MAKTVKCKELCLSDFGLRKVVYRGDVRYDSMRGKAQTNIGYLRRGDCVFTSPDTLLDCHAGDLVYIPEGTRYFSQSHGTPDVEYYIVQLSFRSDAQGDRFDRQFAMQKIEEKYARAFCERLPALYDRLESGGAAEKAAVLAEFYRLFSALIPHLRAEERPAGHSAVRAAVEYIEAHLCEDFSVADLAHAAMISESRLYHLFCADLHTTPTAYKNELRILRAVDAVKTGYQSVEEISASLGFRSPTYFRRLFKEITHMTPTEYRKKYSAL